MDRSFHAGRLLLTGDILIRVDDLVSYCLYDDDLSGVFPDDQRSKIVCTTILMHWQTSSRLGQEFNVCTVAQKRLAFRESTADNMVEALICNTSILCNVINQKHLWDQKHESRDPDVNNFYFVLCVIREIHPLYSSQVWSGLNEKFIENNCRMMDIIVFSYWSLNILLYMIFCFVIAFVLLYGAYPDGLVV